jgi:pilus assembly protein CpaD
MNMRLPAAAASLLALASCGPPPLPAQYSKAEAPAALTLDAVSADIAVRFAPGSARLSPGAVARLDHLALSGRITASDNVIVAAAGGPELAGRRFAAVEHALLAYGIVPQQGALAVVPADHAILHVGRTLVTLPPCPNWSKPSGPDFTNSLASNFGCATASNLGLMVASPGDLAAGRRLGPANGVAAADAMQAYLNGTVPTPKQFDGAEATPGATAGSGAVSTNSGGSQ